MEKHVIQGRYDDHAFLDYSQSNDFVLYEIGIYKCPPMYSYGPVARTRDIFHFVISGRGKLVIRDKEFQIEEDQGFLISAGEKAYYIADRQDPWTYFWVHVGGGRLNEMWERAGINADQPIFASDSGRTNMPELYEQLSDNRDRELYCTGKLYEMMDTIVRTSKSRRTIETNPQLDYVRRIIRIIQLKYSEPLHINYMADVCGLDRSYLSRLFKTATGKSIHNYLTDYRMKNAIRLMKETDETLQNISFRVGYSDLFAFSKAFKKIYGQAPSEYRNNLIHETTEEDPS